MVEFLRVAGAVSAMLDGGSEAREKALGLLGGKKWGRRRSAPNTEWGGLKGERSREAGTKKCGE
jgi:hypothetical protein